VEKIMHADKVIHL
jgi:dynein regulatory complex protein 1